MTKQNKRLSKRLLATGTSKNYTKELNQSIGTSNLINVTFFFLAVVTAIIYTFKGQYEIGIPVAILAISMIGVYYITQRGGHLFSRFILATLPSISVALLASVKKYYLHHVFGSVGIMEYVVPKVILLSFVAIPLALFSLHEKKALFITLLINASIVIFIDNILALYGIDIASVELMLKPKNLLQFAILLSISITVATLYIYKKRSYDAQQETQLKNELLTATEEELRQNIEELTIIQEKLEETNQALKHQHDNRLKSIEYAETIQRSILPSKTRRLRLFPNSFVVFKPKDIVSGDFYWISEHAEKRMLAVIDCTGHGVPGSFISMVAHKILSDIMYQKKIYEPSKILDLLDKGIIKALQQENGKNDDGVDIGLCLIETSDNKNTKVTFAGSKNTIYYTENGTLKDIRGDRRPIGGMKKKKKITDSFTNHELLISEGEMLYLLSDGFQDQNNFNRRKYGSFKCKKLFEQIAKLETNEQKSIIECAFEQHKEEEAQRDDVTILGVRL